MTRKRHPQAGPISRLLAEVRNSHGVWRVKAAQKPESHLCRKKHDTIKFSFPVIVFFQSKISKLLDNVSTDTAEFPLYGWPFCAFSQTPQVSLAPAGMDKALSPTRTPLSWEMRRAERPVQAEQQDIVNASGTWCPLCRNQLRVPVLPPASQNAYYPVTRRPGSTPNPTGKLVWGPVYPGSVLSSAGEQGLSQGTASSGCGEAPAC